MKVAFNHQLHMVKNTWQRDSVRDCLAQAVLMGMSGRDCLDC